MNYPLLGESIWKRNLAIALVLLLCAVLSHSIHSRQDAKQVIPISKDQKEWVSAGFKFGWMSAGDDGTTFFHEKKMDMDLPAFRFSRSYDKLDLTALPMGSSRSSIINYEAFLRIGGVRG